MPGQLDKDSSLATTTLLLDRQRLAELCRRHGIRRLALFGSALRDDFRADSDVDLLVDFAPGRTPGLAFFGIQDELAALLGRKVDLNTAECLSPYFRDEVVSSAEVLYDAG
jgi:predicted nucleotidyltransferase